MTFGMVMRTILEVFVVLFVVWGVFHEDRLAAWEQNLFARLRRRKLRVAKSRFSKKKYSRYA